MRVVRIDDVLIPLYALITSCKGPVYIMKSNGPLTEPCGVPKGSGKESEVTLSMTTACEQAKT